MPARPQHRRSEKPREDGPVWLYGRHAVLAALRNPKRDLLRLALTDNASAWLEAEHKIPGSAESLKPHQIDKLLHQGAVHQGIAAQVSDLPRARLKDVISPEGPGAVVVLDQVTDPQNIGAIIRVAAGFGAKAMIVQDRRTPPLAGALAKAAAGTLETLPVVRAVNISRSLEALQEMGFTTVGLAGEGSVPLPEFRADGPVAVVMGAEGKGIREGVRGHCDALVSIPLREEVESLNVATAAAVTLYALSMAGT
ncbi:23S rRNA (guanosine(2251)-2'-O)-methyltransferase RlmB [Parvularcula maris]|uniref:23S rRNA (Guanosine(2251)-2'-O)-methyltransferase RlmB n=1 Tax=Parvularcula maris TaxID=2965077 RepID=A0A9X2L993_9PROT|nr:23S rRNA (guanosine(2251)-2'-O)-methyltransferase RlmB [Parvularcula maris]MCQ8185278.1 23S rRNA (guanosine(2251)-2'-O)-methyltransferase RlmB [Parvularcula maris]